MNLHLVLFLHWSSRPLLLRLLDCSFLRDNGRLTWPFPQVRSAAHHRLWGCQFYLLTNFLPQLVFEWYGPALREFGIYAKLHLFVQHIPSLISRNMFFLSYIIHPSLSPFSQSWRCVPSTSEASHTGSLFVASRQTSDCDRAPLLTLIPL